MSEPRGVIDVHAHYIARRALELSARSPRAGVSLELGTRGIVVSVDGNRYGPLPPALLDADAQLQAMTAMGIAQSVVSPPPFLFCYGSDADLTEVFATEQNEGIAELVERYPRSFVGLGTVPLQEPERAVRVLTRAMTELGLAGVEIGTNVAGRDLDDPALEPFWIRAEELNALVFIHPSDVRGVPFDAPYYLRNLVGNLLETSYCLSRLIFGGVLARHPGLRILASHGGGFLPYTIGRLDHGYAVRPECRTDLVETPGHYLRQLYFDTITHSAPALRYLVDLVGADHVALGSDYPFDMGTDQPLRQLDALDDPGQRELVESETARYLLKGA